MLCLSSSAQQWHQYSLWVFDILPAPICTWSKSHHSFLSSSIQNTDLPSLVCKHSHHVARHARRRTCRQSSFLYRLHYQWSNNSRTCWFISFATQEPGWQSSRMNLHKNPPIACISVYLWISRTVGKGNILTEINKSWFGSPNLVMWTIQKFWIYCGLGTYGLELRLQDTSLLWSPAYRSMLGAAVPIGSIKGNHRSPRNYMSGMGVGSLVSRVLFHQYGLEQPSGRCNPQNIW